MLLIKLLSLSSIFLAFNVRCAQSSSSTQVATNASDTRNGFKKLIDTYAFREIDSDVVNSLSNETRKMNYIALFQEYQQKYSIPDFEDRHGRNLAVYLATFMASGLASKELVSLSGMFLKLMEQARDHFTNRIYMSLVESLWECLPAKSQVKIEFELICSYYMIQVAYEKGADIVAFSKATAPKSDSEESNNEVMPVKENGEFSPFTSMALRLKMDPIFLRNFCIVSGLSDQQITSIMNELDKQARKCTLNVLKDSGRAETPKDFSDFCNICKKFNGAVFWGEMAIHVLKSVQSHLLEVQNPEPYDKLRNSIDSNNNTLAFHKSVIDHELLKRCGPSIWSAMNEAITKTNDM